MIKMLKLEFMKLWATDYFKVLTVFWVIAFLSIPLGFNAIMDGLINGNHVEENELLNPANWPVFDFVDLWQNLGYIYKMITIFLCLTLVISTANEFRYKTVRQHVIDGLSRENFFLSKLSYILVASIVATVLLLIFGLIIGFALSPITEFAFIIKNIEFVGAYFLHLIHFLSFTLFITIWLKRSGFAIAFILFWVYIIEPITSALVHYNYKMETLAAMFPLESGWNLIPRGFTKYLFQDTQDYVSGSSVLIATVWIVLFLWGSYALLKKRDL